MGKDKVPPPTTARLLAEVVGGSMSEQYEAMAKRVPGLRTWWNTLGLTIYQAGEAANRNAIAKRALGKLNAIERDAIAAFYKAKQRDLI